MLGLASVLLSTAFCDSVLRIQMSEGAWPQPCRHRWEQNLAWIEERYTVTDPTQSVHNRAKGEHKVWIK